MIGVVTLFSLTALKLWPACRCGMDQRGRIVYAANLRGRYCSASAGCGVGPDLERVSEATGRRTPGRYATIRSGLSFILPQGHSQEHKPVM